VYAGGASAPDPACDDAPVTVATRRPSPAALAVGTLALAIAACGAGGGPGSSGCGPITRESLDPAYLVHVLGSQTDVTYASDPPTSGPHQPGPAVEGVVHDPISRPVQVGILERGDILLQHVPDLPAAELADLEALGGPGVVVAPNRDLPAPVVATAWTYKRTCTTVDQDELRAFIDDRAGHGPKS
jgi:hypothetical protein